MRDVFRRKTYGRIFAQNEEHVREVKVTMLQVDKYETERYAPSDLVSVFDKNDLKKNHLIYLHKFEMDKIALTLACLKKGIWIWCVDGGMEDDAVLWGSHDPAP